MDFIPINHMISLPNYIIHGSTSIYDTRTIKRESAYLLLIELDESKATPYTISYDYLNINNFSILNSNKTINLLVLCLNEFQTLMK